MTILSFLLATLAGLVLVPAAVLFTQTLLAWFPAPARGAARAPRAGVAVLIPAHNEAEGIHATLAAVRGQLRHGDRLLVVADNCADATARVAAECGAEVIERVDPDRRGKGYALSFGVDHLRAAPPEVLLILDADCQLEDGSLDRLARLAGAGQPVQALDLMHAPAGAGLKLRIAEFAWRVKNQVRPLGSMRLGLPCQLMGTGMAFPWALIRDARLASAELAEDMQLGIDLALGGHPPRFCPEARVTSLFPESPAAVSSQRTRWEHGHLRLIPRHVPRLLARALARGDARLLGLALDLSVPPLALLLLLIVPQVLLDGALWLLGAPVLPLALAGAALALIELAVGLAWWGWGRDSLSLGHLLAVPLYVAAKLPLYARFLVKRQKAWVRTARD